MPKIRFHHTYNNIISLENLLEAWKEFVRGKRARKDVQEFERDLMTNLIVLHRELATKKYSHSAYQHFKIADPKPRNIHKATVRDRLLHHAIYRILYPFFDRTFISDSFSCRDGKGVHAALNRFHSFSRIASKNHMKTCWVLKGDIRKFFANIDHATLLAILRSYIPDEKTLSLLREVIESFPSPASGVGLPLGNLTSQLFANVYMNEFDQFVKHKLKAKHYIRYADDFVILSSNHDWLEIILPEINAFLRNNLQLTMHPDKVFMQTAASGMDFLGWVHFPDHRVLRTSTKRRMIKRIVSHPTAETLASYAGLLRHGNTHGLQEIYLSDGKRAM